MSSPFLKKQNEEGKGMTTVLGSKGWEIFLRRRFFIIPPKGIVSPKSRAEIGGESRGKQHLQGPGRGFFECDQAIVQGKPAIDQRLHPDQPPAQQVEGGGERSTTGADEGDFVDDDATGIEGDLSMKGAFQDQGSPGANQGSSGPKAGGATRGLDDDVRVGPDGISRIGRESCRDAARRPRQLARVMPYER